MKVKTVCPVCDSKETSIFLTRERVPVGQNLLVGEQEAAYRVPRAELRFAVCERCGFVFNAAFDSSLSIYGQEYDNTQFFSQMFDDYLSRLVEYLINDRGVQNCRVVEVGCGDGYFLKRLVEKGGNTGVGYDPSYRGPLEVMEGQLRFEQSMYGPEQAGNPADVVICRHVIEHVPNPLDLLNSVRYALSKSPSAYVFFETPTVEWILRNHTFWDFFYEHCSIFTAASLTSAFQRTGFAVRQVQAAFGGQYLWLEAGLLPEGAAAEIVYEANNIPVLAREYARLESGLKQSWHEQIRLLNQRGGVALWGAGAKGVTFANLVDPESRYIACVADVNPHKQGHFLSGTGHPIVSYQSLPDYNIKTVIMMNPNYHAEIATLVESSLGSDIQLLAVNEEMEKYQ